MKKPGKWRVTRTHEEWPCEQYRVVRTVDGAVEVFQYADTRAEALELARQANEMGTVNDRV